MARNITLSTLFSYLHTEGGREFQHYESEFHLFDPHKRYTLTQYKHDY